MKYIYIFLHQFIKYSLENLSMYEVMLLKTLVQMQNVQP